MAQLQTYKQFGEPEKKDDSNKEDINKDKHEEALNTKNETKNKGQTTNMSIQSCQKSHKVMTNTYDL